MGQHAMSLDNAVEITVGVLALQGAFSEHLQLLQQAASSLQHTYDGDSTRWTFIEVRTRPQLESCDALVLPGGESTTMSLVAERSGLLEPLRNFVKLQRRPVWGTCAGLILLAESANRTKKGGQELIGGLDVRVQRNHFGRQTESFQAGLDLPFLNDEQAKVQGSAKALFPAVFIRAPVVEKILQPQAAEHVEETGADVVIAPSRPIESQTMKKAVAEGVEVLARLPTTAPRMSQNYPESAEANQDGDIIAVQQVNVFATSFHPELTGDARIHSWWLDQVRHSIRSSAL